MARIRTIKPDFFTSEDIVSLSPLARLLYIATWLEADRDGRFVWRPKTLKLRYLPGDECDIDGLAQELVQAGLVVLYEIDRQTLAEIPSFTRHQVINNRESASSIPARPVDACPTRAPRVNDACLTHDDATATPLMGKEGKGKEGNSTRRVTRAEDESFDKFWSAYPKKTGKGAAEKAWKKIKSPTETLDLILAALEWQKKTPQWLKENNQFVPNPATYLNERRWLDGNNESAESIPKTNQEKTAAFMRRVSGVGA